MLARDSGLEGIRCARAVVTNAPLDGLIAAGKDSEATTNNKGAPARYIGSTGWLPPLNVSDLERAGNGKPTRSGDIESVQGGGGGECRSPPSFPPVNALIHRMRIFPPGHSSVRVAMGCLLITKDNVSQCRTEDRVETDKKGWTFSHVKAGTFSSLEKVSRHRG